MPPELPPQVEAEPQTRYLGGQQQQQPGGMVDAGVNQAAAMLGASSISSNIMRCVQ